VDNVSNELNPLLPVQNTTVLDVLVGLARTTPGAQAFNFAEIDSVPAGKAKATSDPSLQQLVPEARQLRDEYGVPFWMSMILTANRRQQEVPPSILEASGFHQSMDNTTFRSTNIIGLSVQSLLELSNNLAPGRMLTFRSKVTLVDNTPAHFPMLDFRIRPTTDNLKSAIGVAKQLGVRGVILDSGRSYHFYGNDLITPDQLRVFLATASLFTPIVDYRWIAHQLIEGTCALRVSAGVTGQILPKVVSYVQDS
jgi:hypothetical protein